MHSKTSYVTNVIAPYAYILVIGGGADEWALE